MSSSPPSAQEISADARWLIQAIDPNAGQARLVAMDRQSYRLASFLDDRVMTQPMEAYLVPWSIVAAASEQIERHDARWIFHIGHVGSTLISRLLGELPGVLAVREPRSLRDVAWCPDESRENYIKALPRLMSRTFEPSETACIKATSFANELASKLVPEGERALFVIATPRNYIASILAGENSVRELHLLVPARTERLRRRGCELPTASTDDAHLAAAAWACEMTSLEANAAALAGRFLTWIDFDAMLRDPLRGLADIAGHFGFAASETDLNRIISGPILRRYSKAMEFEYSPGLRRDLIAEATLHNRAAIDSAMTMLDKASLQSPQLKRALDRSGEI